MSLITNEAQARAVKAGGSYWFDYPEPPVTEEEINGFDAAFQAAEDLAQKLQLIIDENLAPQEPDMVEVTPEYIKGLKEKELVELANSMGIEAKMSDKKGDTLQKVLTRLEA